MKTEQQHSPLGPCAKCGEQWANPTIRHEGDRTEFYIRCGNCGHEAEPISLKPVIDNWNKRPA